MDRELDPIEARLLQWADYMRRPEAIAAGYSPKAAGNFVASWCKDSEELADAHEVDQAMQIDACIHSLQSPHRIVIYKRHGIGYQVWRFTDEAAVFEQAKAEIGSMLKKRCLI